MTSRNLAPVPGVRHVCSLANLTALIVFVLIVNAVTKTDCYPLPRVDDCVDRVGSAVYISKLDLLKGYWQVPLTERATEISAFVTPDTFLNYKVMAFGMKNAPSTFQRLVNTVLAGVSGCWLAGVSGLLR